MIKDKSLSSKVFDFFLYSMCVVVLIAVLAPVLNIFAVSFSSYDAFARGDVGLLPVEFSTKAYETIIRDGKVLQGLKYSVIYTGLGTLVNILLTVITAYPMSRKEMPFRNAISIYFAFTMFFGGGMIPTYLVVRNLGLLNTRWAILLTGLVSTYNLMIARTYFCHSIPNEIREAAVIDGASEMRYFLKIAIPLAAPITVVLAMYYGSAHWNNYFSAMMYLPTNKSLVPLQLLLREILIMESSELSASTGAFTDAGGTAIYAMTLKYAIIVVAILPILIAFPWIQKYFSKGLMVGSLKG